MSEAEAVALGLKEASEGAGADAGDAASDEVRPADESADDAGEESEGAAGESVDQAGEESNEPAEAEGDEKWKLFLKLADGDEKRALALAETYYKQEGAGSKTGTQPIEALPEAATRAIHARVDKFYEESASKEAGAEKKALAALLTDLQLGTIRDVGAVLDSFEARLAQRDRTERGKTALFKAYPTWIKDKGALTKFVAADPARARLSDIDAYELFLAKRGRSSGSTAASGVAAGLAADKKARMAGAVGGNANGRPSGPNERRQVSPESREAGIAHAQANRFLRLP